MTNARIEKLRKIIEDSRGRIMEKHPLFTLLMMHLKFVADENMKKISTNGGCIYFNPDFLQRLAPGELDILLCHQILHITTGHIFRPLEYRGDAYHYACDEEIKQYLLELGWDSNQYNRLSKTFTYNSPGFPNPRNVTEAYFKIRFWFNKMPKSTTSRYLGDSDIWWSRRHNNGEGCTLILDSDNHTSTRTSSIEKSISDSDDKEYFGTGEDMEGKGFEKTGSGEDGDKSEMSIDEENDEEGIEELQGKWERWVASAMANSNDDGTANGCTTTPLYIRRMKQRLKRKPKLDWKKVLNEFVQEQITDYSFSPPDIRYSETGFFLPAFNEKEYITKDILFMVDTSGSVQDEMINIAYTEISGAIEQFNGGLRGQLGFFDEDVKSIQSFETVSDLQGIVPIGGGGTNFCSVFDYLSKHTSSLPACMVIITDGMGPYPYENETLGIPTLWLINNNDYTPPFGRVARIYGDSDRI